MHKHTAHLYVGSSGRAVLGAAKYWQGQFIQVPPTRYEYDIFDQKSYTMLGTRI